MSTGFRIGTVIQILSIDLGTDLVPAIGLGHEPPEGEAVDRPPRGQCMPETTVAPGTHGARGAGAVSRGLAVQRVARYSHPFRRECTVNLLTKVRFLCVAFHSGIFLVLAAVSSMPTCAARAESAQCPTLTSLAFPNTTITQTQLIDAGEFALSPGEHSQDSVQSGFKDLPTFCRVAATLQPTSDSEIKIEVWMPASGWNGKFQAVGNGGWAGAISPA